MNSFLKYFFVIFNLIFIGCGALCAGFVLWIKANSLLSSSLSEAKLDEPMFYFGIFLGGLLILIGLCGALGACYEKKIILVIYLGVIIFFIGCELAAIIYTVVVGKNEVVEDLEKVWMEVENETRFAVQRAFNCCGYLSASEWGNMLPDSCFNITSSNREEQRVQWSDSCSDEILKWFLSNILVFGGALGATLLLQVFQAVVTSLLIRSMNSNRIENTSRNRPQPSNMNDTSTYGGENMAYQNTSFAEESWYEDSKKPTQRKIERLKTEW